MKKVTKVFEVYRYEELSGHAKSKASSCVTEYITDCDDFTNSCEFKLAQIFPNSALNVEYQLAYCQGDYFNFYGGIDLNDILNRIIAKLTEKQIKVFRHIIKSWKDTHTIYSKRAFYDCNIANNCNIFEGVIGDMEYYGYRDIPEKDIVAIADIAGQFLDDVCAQLMKDGYNYFYPDESEIEMFCSENEWYFTIDGTPYFD